MGTWKITVEGCGCHHNANPKIDADLATQDFVDALVAQGHDVKVAKMEMTDYTGKVMEGSPFNTDFISQLAAREAEDAQRS